MNEGLLRLPHLTLAFLMLDGDPPDLSLMVSEMEPLDFSFDGSFDYSTLSDMDITFDNWAFNLTFCFFASMVFKVWFLHTFL